MFDTVQEMNIRKTRKNTGIYIPHSIIDQLSTPVQWENFLGNTSRASKIFKELTGEPFLKTTPNIKEE